MKKFHGVLGWMLFVLTGSVMAQVVLPPPDAQGWIKIFRGSQDAASFYTYYGSVPPAQAMRTFPDNTFRIRGDSVDVSGSPTGHLIYRIPFSHYRVRYQMRFPGNTVNCGMLLHVQDSDPILFGSFPRSLEAQGDPGQGMGQLWAISDVWVNITVQGTSNGNPRFNAAGRDTVYGGRDANSRCVTGKDGWGQPSYSQLANQGGGWVTQEAYVYGRDSIVVRVADTVRIKYRLPRVSSGGTPNNVTKYLQKGLLAWQSEGASNTSTAVFYRNMQVMLMPGDSLYVPTYLDFHRRNSITPPSGKKILYGRNGLLIFRESGMTETLFDLRGHKILTPETFFSRPR